jgi:hypothetical protein
VTAEIIPPPSGSGTVVLNLGPGTGALVLHAPAELNSVEIEISPTSEAGGPRTHSRVRERRTPASVQHAAVYPDLPAGDYTIWRDHITPAATVTITGGRVTSCEWPTAGSAENRQTSHETGSGSAENRQTSHETGLRRRGSL